MLAAVGVGSLDELVDEAVPSGIRLDHRSDLPEAGTEAEVLARLRALADRNEVVTSMIGMGYSGTITPPVILRNVLENPAWYTAYTPYQPEICQGRLEALLNFQTMVTDLTGMDLANASLLDEATAAAEAMTLCPPGRQAGRRHVLRRRRLPPADHRGGRDPGRAARASRCIVGDPVTGLDGSDAFGVLVQYPGSVGGVRDLAPIVEQVHERGRARRRGRRPAGPDPAAGPRGRSAPTSSSARASASACPLGFGGPHAGFMAVRQAHARSLPGRLVGVSVDEAGRPGLPPGPADPRAAHPPREGHQQHLHRPGAAGGHGLDVRRVPRPRRAAAIAEQVHERTTRLAAGLAGAGVGDEHEPSSTRSPAVVPGRAAEVVRRRARAGASTCAWSTPTASASPSTRRRPPRAVEAVWAAFGVSTAAD